MREEEKFLQEYDLDSYDKPSVTNDIIIFTMADKFENNSRKMPRKGLQVLLIKRDDFPFKDTYAIPGGFIRLDEGIEEGALRKLRDKTHIENLYIEQLYTFGDVNRDVRGRVITVAHLALIRKCEIEKTIDDNCKWFWVDKILLEEDDEKKVYKLTLEAEEGNELFCYKAFKSKKRSSFICDKGEYILLKEIGLAFDHIKIIDYAVERLRNKLEYTPIAFNLVPEFFTVKELQNVYEGIMGREILNFRRKLGTLIVETEEKIEGKPYRPAKIYKFNKGYNSSF